MKPFGTYACNECNSGRPCVINQYMEKQECPVSGCIFEFLKSHYGANEAKWELV